MGQIKNIKLHIVTGIKAIEQRKWVAVQLVVTATARTNLTPSLVSVEVYQTQRFESSILARRRPVSMSFQSVSTWCLTNMSSCLQKPWKQLASAPTNTLPRSLVRMPSTSVFESTPSTLSASTKCCRVQELTVNLKERWLVSTSVNR